jgi:hypothetical protein
MDGHYILLAEQREASRWMIPMLMFVPSCGRNELAVPSGHLWNYAGLEGCLRDLYVSVLPSLW